MQLLNRVKHLGIISLHMLRTCMLKLQSASERNQIRSNYKWRAILHSQIEGPYIENINSSQIDIQF